MTARILCLIVVILEIITLRFTWPERKWKLLVFYTQLSNTIAMVSALLLVILGVQPWLGVLRFLGTCMMVMTFLVTAFVLVPMGGDPKMLLWCGTGLPLHIICPILTAVSYIFFEWHAGWEWVWLPPVVTLLYGIILLILNAKGRVDGPYPFFRVHNQTARATVIWVSVLFAAITGISVLIRIIAG